MDEPLDAWWTMDRDRLVQALRDQAIPEAESEDFADRIIRAIATKPEFRAVLEQMQLQNMWER